MSSGSSRSFAAGWLPDSGESSAQPGAIRSGAAFSTPLSWPLPAGRQPHQLPVQTVRAVAAPAPGLTGALVAVGQHYPLQPGNRAEQPRLFDNFSARCLATASDSPETSTPVTCAPHRANNNEFSPRPQPTSSNRLPLMSPRISYATSRG